MKDYIKAATNVIKEYLAQKGIEPAVETHYSAMIDAFGLFTDEEKPIPYPPYSKSILLLSAITNNDGTLTVEETADAYKYMRPVNKQQLAV